MSWTDSLPDCDHVNFFRFTDWHNTLLGPLGSWGPALRLHTHLVMADSRASVLYWGPERVAIYNESFIPLASGTHPKLMGKPFRDAFPEIWDHIRPIFNQAEASGAAVDVNDMLLFVSRSGYNEEAYFNGSFIPLRDLDGKVQGFMNTVYDVTRQKLRDRRTAMLNLIATPPQQDTRTLGNYFMTCLETNEFDIPMAILYEVDEESVQGTCTLQLRGLIGVPADHALAMDQVTIESDDGIIPVIREAKKNGIVTANVDGRFGGVAWRGFGEPSKLFSVLRLLGGGTLLGFLIVGLNPRRAHDDTSQQFLSDLSRHSSFTMASMFTAEQALKREQRLEKELAESERQIRFMAQHAAVGMLHVQVDGTKIWANEQFYRLAGQPASDPAWDEEYSVFNLLHEEDLDKAQNAWGQLLQGSPETSIELRFRRVFTPPVGDPEPVCVLSHSFPYVEDGTVKSIMSCITDISRLKWSEGMEARNAAAATEAKRQQEEFIDLVSHEMRNPLSAMFHCAESIVASSEPQHADNSASLGKRDELLAGNIEAARQILVCAKHQKRIIDDVLTLSRLESRMLSLVAVPVRVSEFVNAAVKMFDTECVTHNIHTRVVADPSIEENRADFVICDPSRATQIFINLLSNAIKFTKAERKRKISIRYGARMTDPRRAFQDDVMWASNNNALDDPTLKAEWGTGEQIYLTFEISDSGIGMEAAEMQRLFDRFRQGNAKTHIKYGGSGLGLFISKQLAETQGGEIGVASTPGHGSVFVFTLKSRRTAAPVNSVVYGRSLQLAGTVPVMNGSSPRSFSILLVEDNKINQQVLQKQLIKGGCTVYVANNGLDALEVIRSTDCWRDQTGEGIKGLDFILMDLEMPVMNGLDCSREIRALEKSGLITRHVEIIAITANARSEQLETALSAGMDDVMPKPFTVADLMAKMSERGANVRLPD